MRLTLGRGLRWFWAVCRPATPTPGSDTDADLALALRYQSELDATRNDSSVARDIQREIQEDQDTRMAQALMHEEEFEEQRRVAARSRVRDPRDLFLGGFFDRGCDRLDATFLPLILPASTALQASSPHTHAPTHAHTALAGSAVHRTLLHSRVET